MPFAPRLATLPVAQRLLWPELKIVPQEFVLYGGTAVALRLGHRTSVDFDFFSAESFDPFALRQILDGLGNGQILQAEPNVLTLIQDRQGDVKLSFFGGIGGRVGDPEDTEDGVLRVASPLDLLGRKLKTILQRAHGKDYEDIVALLRAGLPLDRGLGAAAALFAPGFPVAESAKALGYFADLEESWRLKEVDHRLLLEAVRTLGTQIPVVPLVSRMLSVTPPEGGVS